MARIISIIVPVYNVEPYLPYCLDSIIEQTYKDLEIILINDGSSDKSGYICDEYAQKDNRIKVIHKENGGQCSARNAGLDAATGDLLMFIDSDDCVDKKICEKLVLTMNNTNADMVRCGFIRFSEYGKPIIKDDIETGSISIYTTEKAFHIFVCDPYSNRKQFIPMVCAAVYKRSLFDGIPFPEGKIYEEGFVLPKVFLRCEKLAYIDESLYHYYFNDNGTMASGFSEKGLKSIDDWREIHFLIYGAIPSLREPTAKRWIDKYINTYFALVKRNDIDKDGYYKNYIRDELKSNKSHFSKFASKNLMKRIKKFNRNPRAYERYARRKQKQGGILVNWIKNKF